MPLYRDDAVVLRTQKLGEADRILSLLTRTRGHVRAVAKGVRRTTSKFGARLEPFTVVDAQFVEGRTLDTVTQAVTRAAYGTRIAGDYDSYTAAAAICETADRLTEDADPAPEQFMLLVGALASLARRAHHPEAVLASYALRALSLAGWRPSLEACALCGGADGADGAGEDALVAFAPQLGGAVCERCAPPGIVRPGHDVIALLDALLEGDWGRVDAADPRTLQVAAQLVSQYTQFQLDRAVTAMRAAVGG